MTTLDEHDRELLASYKAAISPSDADARLDWEVIAEQVELESEDDQTRTGGRRWWWLGVAAAVIAVVSYVELRVSSLRGTTVEPSGSQAMDQVAPPLPSRAESAPMPANVPRAPNAEDEPEPSASALPPVEPSPEVDRAPSESSSAAPSKPSARVRRRTRPVEAEHEKPAPSPESSSSASDLRAEMALLGRARASLAAKDFERALSLVDRYEREHPRGMMREEAAALRVGALCEVGPRARWEKARRRFRRDFPGSPLETHLDEACFD